MSVARRDVVVTPVSVTTQVMMGRRNIPMKTDSAIQAISLQGKPHERKMMDTCSTTKAGNILTRLRRGETSQTPTISALTTKPNQGKRGWGTVKSLIR